MLLSFSFLNRRLPMMKCFRFFNRWYETLKRFLVRGRMDEAGFQPFGVFDFFPGALPQAGMERAVGAEGSPRDIQD
jgi:hypothetical protein